MAKYREIPMSQRIDKIGELLIKGVYLYLQKQKTRDKNESNCVIHKVYLDRGKRSSENAIHTDFEAKPE